MKDLISSPEKSGEEQVLPDQVFVGADIIYIQKRFDGVV